MGALIPGAVDRYTPVIKAAERRLVELAPGTTVVLSSEEFEFVLRHAMGIMKIMLNASTAP